MKHIKKFNIYKNVITDIFEKLRDRFNKSEIDSLKHNIKSKIKEIEGHFSNKAETVVKVADVTQDEVIVSAENGIKENFSRKEYRFKIKDLIKNEDISSHDEYKVDSEFKENVKKSFPDKAEIIIKTVEFYGTGRTAEVCLDKINDLIKGHGVENITRDAFEKNDVYKSSDKIYFVDTVALYVNLGDTYITTILYDVVKEDYFCTSYGDWLEENDVLVYDDTSKFDESDLEDMNESKMPGLVKDDIIFTAKDMLDAIKHGKNLCGVENKIKGYKGVNLLSPTAYVREVGARNKKMTEKKAKK